MTGNKVDALIDDIATADAAPRVARFLSGEVERILAIVRAEPSDREYADDEIGAHADVLLAAADGLVRLSAFAGHLAPLRTIQLWASSLAALVPGQRHGSRSSIWEQLATYPAALLAYSLGVGASAARRYDALAWMFASPVPNERGEWRPLIELIHPFAIEQRVGVHLRATNFRLSPFSDHLHVVLRPSFKDLLIRDDHFEREFDRFELLVGLGQYHLSGASGSDVWFPMGRALRLGRYRENASRMLLEDEGVSPDAGSALLRAMGRDPGAIDNALDGFHRAAGSQLSRALFVP